MKSATEAQGTPPPLRARLRGALRSRWLWALALIAVLAVAALGYWRGRVVDVDALALEPRALQRTLQFSGRVQSRARVDLGSTLTGRVARVQVRAGDRVEAGAVLLTLETDELRAALAQAQGALRQAQARSVSQRAVSRPSTDAALAQAEASLAAAEREYTRTQALLAADFVSAARLDEARRAVDIARAQRDAARAQARANLGDGPETASARAQQDVALATLQAAQARLAQATLRAPAAGQVIVRDVEPGQIVQPGRALLTLAIDGPTEIEALVDERFLGQLAQGQRARVLADAYPSQPFDATLKRMAPAVDAQRGAVEVTFGVDAPPPFLREDMTLSVEVLTGTRDAALVLPLRALRDDGTVRVAVDGRVQVRAVQTGLRTLDQAEVTDGLARGDVVLLNPALAEGARVRPRRVDAVQAMRPAAGGGGGEGLGNAMSGGAVR